MPWVYILECSDGSYYTGSTWDVDKRLWEHGLGIGSDYTRPRRPVTLRYAAFSESIQEAWGWERKIHGWSRAKKLALIENRFADLPGLSANRAKREALDRKNEDGGA